MCKIGCAALQRIQVQSAQVKIPATASISRGQILLDNIIKGYEVNKANTRLMDVSGSKLLV
jgi:hypothetical protein